METPYINISINAEGKVEITSNVINNKLLAYGLLKEAEYIVREFVPSPIVKPNGLKVIN
jgi:hypothetical protein